jgi:hypothetical protein
MKKWFPNFIDAHVALFPEVDFPRPGSASESSAWDPWRKAFAERSITEAEANRVSLKLAGAKLPASDHMTHLRIFLEAIEADRETRVPDNPSKLYARQRAEFAAEYDELKRRWDALHPRQRTEFRKAALAACPWADPSARTTILMIAIGEMVRREQGLPPSLPGVIAQRPKRSDDGDLHDRKWRYVPRCEPSQDDRGYWTSRLNDPDGMIRENARRALGYPPTPDRRPPGSPLTDEERKTAWSEVIHET